MANSGVSKRSPISGFLLWTAILAVLLGAAVWLPRWIPRLLVPNLASFPVNTSGYEVQPLPHPFAAVCVWSNRVIYATPDGRIYRASEDELLSRAQPVPTPVAGGLPRLLFATRDGIMFVSTMDGPVYRSPDEGRTWQAVLPVACWRMCELPSGQLVMGNYPGPITQDGKRMSATIFISNDKGLTWTPREIDSRCWHVHTVRWDEERHRLYVAYGDGDHRGEGYIDWQNDRLVITGSGRGHGYTDSVIGPDFIIWGSDDQTGRVLRMSPDGKDSNIVLGWSQYIWWMTGDNQAIYLGTMPGMAGGGERAAVLASSDKGHTWQKLVESQPSRKAYDRGWHADSRQISQQGWIYFSNEETAFRIRKTGAPHGVADTK